MKIIKPIYIVTLIMLSLSYSQNAVSRVSQKASYSHTSITQQMKKLNIDGKMQYIIDAQLSTFDRYDREANIETLISKAQSTKGVRLYSVEDAPLVFNELDNVLLLNKSVRILDLKGCDNIKFIKHAETETLKFRYTIYQNADLSADDNISLFKVNFEDKIISVLFKASSTQPSKKIVSAVLKALENNKKLLNSARSPYKMTVFFKEISNPKFINRAQEA